MASEPTRPPQQPPAWPSTPPAWPDLPPPDPMDEPQGTHSASASGRGPLPGYGTESQFAPPLRGEGAAPASPFRQPFPGTETTVTYGEQSPAGPPSGPPADRWPADAAGRGAPQYDPPRHGAPPHDLPPQETSRHGAPSPEMPPHDAPRHGMPAPGAPQHAVPPQEAPRHGESRQPQPEDPYRPFVTAGQISGPKTPPPERQQELWNNVFVDNYEAMGDEDDLAGEGRPIWLFALIGSAAVALVLVLLWTFLAGPLSSDGKSTAAASPSATAASPKATTKPQSIGRLPRYPGTASPVRGRLTDQEAAITLPRLGGQWRLDLRAEHIRSTYGFATRQYVAAGTDTTGQPRFAMVMSGPLPQRLAGRYTSPDTLGPVINAVAVVARRNYFPEGNKAVKTAQQRITVNGLPGQLSAYEITAGEQKTTMVVAAVSTGADLPAIVYMQVPDSKKNLLPDVNTVFRSIRLVNP